MLGNRPMNDPTPSPHADPILRLLLEENIPALEQALESGWDINLGDHGALPDLYHREVGRLVCSLLIGRLT